MFRADAGFAGAYVVKTRRDSTARLLRFFCGADTTRAPKKPSYKREMKNKGMNDAQFLALLQKVLPKATKDPHLATAIYVEVEKEVRLQKSIVAFEKFCETGGVPDAEPNTVAELQSELAGKFGEENVAIVPEENGSSLSVEIALPDRTVSSRVKVDPSV